MNKHVEVSWVQGVWVCSRCHREPVYVYVATAHDHTDGTLRLCDCGAGVDIDRVLGSYNNLINPLSIYEEDKTRNLGKRPRIGQVPD